MRRLLLALGLGAFALTACDVHPGPTQAIQGSGTARTETRKVQGFDRVALAGPGTLTIDQGSSEGLTITADDNVLSNLRSDVSGGTLQLGPRPNTEIRASTIHYRLQAIRLDTISLDGAAGVEAGRLRADQFDLRADGSGSVEVVGLQVSQLKISIAGSSLVNMSGQATDQTITMSGSGRYRADDLRSQRASVQMTGSGLCTLRVSDRLDVSISGSGHVTYVGSPTVQTHVTGSGGVAQVG